MKISYDWRGMPVEFKIQNTENSEDSTRLTMMYDGSGRRVAKTRARKAAGATDWETELVTHYTGIGTEVREYKPRNFVRYTDSAGVEHCVSANPGYGGNASTACPLPDTVKVAVPLPQELGRYALQDVGQVDEIGAPQAFEWYLKNHLGSTMLVYGTGFPDPLGISPEGELRAAYDYRSFGEQLDLLVFTRKITENFTGKERDDETQLDYFGARYLDPMLGMWISVDPKRQFASPYLYAGNEANSINGVDPDGNGWASAVASAPSAFYNLYLAESNAASRGESYFGMVQAGLIAFFTTLGAGALMGPTSTAGQMAFGAASAALVETADQAIAQEKLPSEWDVDEIAHQARNGAILGLIGGLSGDAALSVLNLSGEASGVISGTVGTLETMLFTTGVEKGYIQDEWNSCSDK